MEDTLRGTDFLTLFDETDVLILVVMEDTLRESYKKGTHE